MSNYSFDNILCRTDIEYAIIILLLSVLFVFSLKPDKVNTFKQKQAFLSCLEHGKQMSVLLKGCACVMILMSHYATRVLGGGLPKGVSYYVAIYAANVALVLFMYISGYGLSKLQTTKNFVSYRAHGNECFSRLIKVYSPLLFICLLHTALFVLPDPHVSGEGKFLYAIGLADEWYVICIIYFYALYYLSLGAAYLFRTNQTVVLAVLMLVYYAIAYHVYGEAQAHYYRFPLAFMTGHLIALRNQNPKYITWIVTILMMMTLLPLEFHYTKVYVVSFLILLVAGFVDKICEIRAGSILYCLGVISYFFYLTHERLGFRILEFLGVRSCILWILITILVATVSKYMYDKTLKFQRK